jgi:hypothetical protein
VPAHKVPDEVIDAISVNTKRYLADKRAEAAAHAKK